MEKELEQMLQTVCSKGIKEASSEEIYAALLQWSKEKMNGMKHNEGDRKLYYISAEFLVGKLLSNNLINLGVFEEVREVLKKHGHDLTEIEEVELEPSLGNGGLGRLAACFLDSIATLGLNGDGVGPVSYTHLNMAMILGLFPGFMSMIAVYFILKAMGLTEGNLIRLALILVYSGGAGLGFQIAKGFFDTIPIAIDEAALLDGCTRWQIFTKITLPLSKPIIIYTVLTSFMGPWLDFIFAKVICRANSDQYTIAIGLWKMLEKEYIDSWYTSFAAGAVLISIPIAILFLCMQRFYVDGVSGAVKG